MVGILGVLVLLGGLAQDSDTLLPERIRSHVRDLSSDEPEIRERAENELKRIGPSALATLDKLLPDAKDSDTRLRIQGVIKGLWVLKSDALLGEGRLQDALMALATAENPDDPKGHSEKRIAEARKDVAPEVSPPNEGKRVSNARSTAKALREKHGRWALPALLDSLLPKVPDTSVEGLELLKYWGVDAIPALVASLREKNEEFVSVVVEALHIMGRGDPVVRKELSKLAQDKSRSEKLRSLADAILTDMGGKLEKP